jgi:hypothetical protein
MKQRSYLYLYRGFLCLFKSLLTLSLERVKRNETKELSVSVSSPIHGQDSGLGMSDCAAVQ